MIIQFLAAATVAAQPGNVAMISPVHGLIEGVATDGRTIWASSVLDREILRCTAKCHRLATLPIGLHPLGIAWDAKRKQLWVAADCPELPGIAKCERGALVATDLRGRIRARIAPAVGAFHPGDVSASPSGEVFVGDSQNGAVYRLLPNGRELGDVVLPGVGKSAQGSALEGKRLIVADYSQGVTAIDLGSGARTILKRDDGRPVRGIDGMIRCGRNYYAIYNGAPLGQLIRFTVAGDRIAVETLVAGGALSDPTQLATDGKRLLIIANAGWELAAKNLPRADPAPIVSLALAEPC